MKTNSIIGILALLLGTAATATAQDNCHEFDRARGECSVGTEAPSTAALVNAIRTAPAQRLMGTLEYGERVECYDCVPELFHRIMTDGDAQVREFGAWWLRRRHLSVNHLFIELKAILAGTPSAWAGPEDDGGRGYTEPVHRARAAEALGEFLDPNALAPLTTAAMNDTEPVVRAAAVSALGRLNHPQGNTVLAAALSDGSADVRRAAVMAIPRVNFFREHVALIGTLADDDAQVRRQGALLLGQFRVADAVDALAGALRSDEDASVRRSAAWALGRIGTTAARDALNEAMGSERVSMVLDAVEVALRM
jgi:hypothetical protein